MPQCVERLKGFRPQYPREVQNDRSQLFNTVAHELNGLCGCNSSFPHCGGNITAYVYQQSAVAWHNESLDLF